MKTLVLGGLRVVATGGSDRDGGGDGPAILLCHGYGAPGEDLVPLARVTDVGREVRWFFPAAALELDLGWGVAGRAWWHIDIARLQEQQMRGERRQLMAETPDGLAASRAALEACIATLVAEHGVHRDRLVVGGFSQGGMLATEVALHAPSPFAGLAVLSGTLLSEDRWRAAAVGSARRLRALVTHGRADPLLPFEGAEALRDLLQGAGADVDWVPHGGQHEIPPVVLDRLASFAKACFAGEDRGDNG